MTYRMRIFSAVIGGMFAVAGTPCRASFTGESVAWIHTLRCRDLLQQDKSRTNGDLSKFAVWLMGFEAGVSAVPPLNQAGYSASTSKNIEAILGICAQRPEITAVDAAVDFMAMQYNLAHTEGDAINFLEPMVPEE